MREGSLFTGKTLLSLILAAAIAALLVFVAAPDAYKQGWGYGYSGGGGGAPAQYDVVVVVNPIDGGEVTLNPVGGKYYSGTSVTFTAVPEVGYEFDGWSGDLTGTENPTITKVYSDMSITANFVQTSTSTPEPLTEDISGRIDASGMVTEGITFDCTDCGATVEIPADTTILDEDGNPTVAWLNCQYPEPPSDVPEGVHIIVLADFGPDGAQFSSPVRITMIYDPDTLPEDVLEDSLVVAYYDSDGNWVYLTNIVVDPINHTVSGEIDHFTVFAVLGQEEEEEEPVVTEPTAEPTPPSEPAVIEPTSEPTPPTEPAVVEPVSSPESPTAADEVQQPTSQEDGDDDGDDDGVNPWAIIVPILVILVLGIGGYLFIQRRRAVV